MKNIYTFLFSSLLVGLFALSGYSQADTIVVPNMIDGNPYGAFNIFINGDTLADGTRTNAERVYKLEQNQIYFMNGILSAHFDLKIIADKATGSNKPPILTTGINSMGAAAAKDLYIQCFQDAEFKNIILQNTPPNQSEEIAFTIQLLKEDGKYLFDNVFWQGSRWLSIGSWAVHPSVTIKNCYFRNVQNTTSVWNGRGISFQDRSVDTIRMINNTFFNVNSFVFQGHSTTVDYFQFEHNTIVNTVKWPFQFQWMTNAKIANNIFQNVHSYGESESERIGQDIDSLEFGIMNLTNLPQDYLDSMELNLSEKGRIVKFHNNSYFYTSEVTDYWASNDSIEGGKLMNARTMSYFQDSENYPYITNQNTMNMDPGFVNDGDVEAKMVAWMNDRRMELEGGYWGYDPDEDRFNVQWPVPEDLSYTNSTLLTGGTNGFPIGDLNWFGDDKVAEWETAIISSVDEPSHFTLQLNTPNPFSTSTEIHYSLDRNAQVKISVYDFTGKLVNVLLNTNQSAGNHSLTWSPNNQAAGIYFYKLQSEGSSSIGKMVYIAK